METAAVPFPEPSGSATSPAPASAAPEIVRPLKDGAALVVDRNGRVVACGPSMPLALLPDAPRPGDHVLEISPPALGDCLGRLWLECRREGQPAAAELVLSVEPSAPTEPVTLSFRAGPHPEADGFFVFTIRDLSRDRSRVQVLLDHVSRLDHRARDAEAAARASAHDVRSAVAALKGFLQLALRKGRNPSAGAEEIRSAMEIAERIAGIARSVQSLDECGPVPDAPIDLGPLAHRMFRALRAASPDACFTWCVSAADLRPRIPTDALWEILWCLLTNAVRYKAADRPLHVELRAWLDEGEAWIEVRDNGRGIPAGEETAVFEQGYRGTNAADVEGTGLGLFSARRLTERSGGRVWAEPSYHGAVFRLVLPAWDLARPRPPRPRPAPPSPARPV